MVPGWQVLFTRTLLSMADYWPGGLEVPAVTDGAERSYLAAILSILLHSADTVGRLAAGLVLGGVAGLALGLALSSSRWTRRIIDWPVQFLRTLPLLAMVPLFQLWFGTDTLGEVMFVAYGIGVIVLVGTVNAVRNVSRILLDNGRALGASRLMLTRTVVLPAIVPAMRSTVLLSLGADWGAVLGAEYLGAQSGLGYVIVYAQQFAFLDRMFLVALLFVLYTALSTWAVARLTARMLAWAPEGQRAFHMIPRSLDRDFVGYGAHPPDPRWPGGARLALNFVMNYEEGSEYSMMDRDGVSDAALTELSSAAVPRGDRDLAAESMFEYGSRVGFWRLMRLFAERGLPMTVFACALALERNAEAAAAIREAGHDICCHGWRWVEHFKLDEATEREHIRRAIESLRHTVGVRPLGWYCRYGPSVNTRRLVVEEGGFSYDSDSYADELPYWVAAEGRPSSSCPTR